MLTQPFYIQKSFILIYMYIAIKLMKKKQLKVCNLNIHIVTNLQNLIMYLFLI